MNISTYPKMTKDARKSFSRAMRNRAFPKHLQKEMDFEEFAKRMGMTSGKPT